VDGGLAGGNQEKAFEDLGDAPGAIFRVGLLDGYRPFPDLWCYGRPATRTGLRRQPFDPALPVGGNPTQDRVLADAELRADQGGTVAFLQKELHDPEAELDRVGPGSPPFPSATCVLRFFLCHRVISFLCN
jgi:hypothetical protein